jgi:RHS repeat-associated protein
VVSFQEGRGVRFSTDDKGAFVQDVDYEPFGEATSSGVTAGDPKYSPEQWNGGDALGSVGLVQMGARLYDPVIGRFLSRDPLFAPRTAATTNPYAFADNDPIGKSDPTGLCSEGDENCNSWFPIIIPGGGGSQSNNNGSASNLHIKPKWVRQNLPPNTQPPSSNDDHPVVWAGVEWTGNLLTLSEWPFPSDELDDTLVQARKIGGVFLSVLSVGHSAYANLHKNWDGGLGAVRFGGDAGGAVWAFYSPWGVVGTEGAKWGAIGLGHVVRSIEDANEEGRYGSPEYKIKESEEEHEQYHRWLRKQMREAQEVRTEARLEPLIEKVGNAEWDKELQTIYPSCSGPGPKTLTDMLPSP